MKGVGILETIFPSFIVYQIIMKRMTGFMAILAILGVVSYAARSEWVAYNDSVYRDGEFIADNVTTFAIGRSNPHPESGNLINQSDDSDTGVTVTYSEFKTSGSVNWAGDSAEFADGTDAAETFNDFVDPTGNISYGDAPGWYVDLTIEGLEPAGLYTFAGSVNRNGGADYADRVTNWKIIGADAFTYASSDTAHKVAEDTVEFSTGQNDAGLVARWTDINPGSDGEVVIRTSHSVGEANGGIAGAHEYKGYAGGVFMLEFQGYGEPSAVEVYGKLAATWSKIKSAR
jgi:hypothetical protein